MDVVDESDRINITDNDNSGYIAAIILLDRLVHIMVQTHNADITQIFLRNLTSNSPLNANNLHVCTT